MSWVCHTCIKNDTIRDETRCLDAWHIDRLIAYNEWDRTHNSVTIQLWFDEKLTLYLHLIFYNLEAISTPLN